MTWFGCPVQACSMTLTRRLPEKSEMDESCPDDGVLVSFSKLIPEYGSFGSGLIFCFWCLQLVLVPLMLLAIDLVT